MGVIKANKELSTPSVECGGSFKIKLSLTAEPDITTNPTDIVMILDRSGSMAGSSLANLKSGARKFIDIIDEVTDGVQDGQIGYGSRIGIVSFAGMAVQDTQLITSVADLKAAVNALSAGGATNHADAFAKALQLFDPLSMNAKVMVMFTDGETTVGEDPAPIAEAAKAQGVTIYCVGLSGNGGIDVNALNDWASEPSSAYVSITPDDEELEDIFEDLAANIAKQGATDIVITEKVSSCFKIVSVSRPEKGTASLIDSVTLQWKIDALGVKSSEGAVLEFEVRHVGCCSGKIKVNESITYSDHEGNHVVFPDPEIDVDCGVDVVAEPCPDPVDITIGGCQEAAEIHAGNINLSSLGCILQLDVTIKNVCPHRRVGLAVILYEVDNHGNEFKRGIKILTVPAHTMEGCRDITVKCINFVLPEDLDVSSSSHSFCDSRKFKARFLANYIDNDFECCGRNCNP